MKDHPDVLATDLTIEKELNCRKDLGEKGRMHFWSRGHLFIVRSCGHIDTFKPIYFQFLDDLFCVFEICLARFRLQKVPKRCISGETVKQMKQ